MILPGHRLRRGAVLLMGVLSWAALLASGPDRSAGGSACNKIAAPHGSDSAAGSEEAPLRSLEQLVHSLEPGEVGCLRGGVYGGDSVYFEAPGAELRSYPGETATITAFMEVKPSAVGAHIHHLSFDASWHSNNTGVKLQADGTRFTDNELTKGGRGICLLAGSYHPAAGIVIERNRIYDCGPTNSKLMHQIYLQNTRGAIVRWNVLTGNAGGWGVHLYANADDTLIAHNIIDGNRGGVIFAGAEGKTSDRNVVRNNAITFSQQRWNIEGSWSNAPPGVDNHASGNCVYSTGEHAPSGIEEGDGGFRADANAVAAGSPYLARNSGDYRFRANSRCARLVGDVAGVVTGQPPRPARALRAGASRVRRGTPWITQARAVG